MERLLYFTELLGLKVFDLRKRAIGRVRDCALAPPIHPVRIDRFLVGAGAGWRFSPYGTIRCSRFPWTASISATSS